MFCRDTGGSIGKGLEKAAALQPVGRSFLPCNEISSPKLHSTLMACWSPFVPKNLRNHQALANQRPLYRFFELKATSYSGYARSFFVVLGMKRPQARAFR
eukprot:GHVN01020030.1.p1 GENE.GHVN01020030.1~~GHVN01020030.1.p1  ORF type:complete len:100 (+),score=0.08 GHVN01020030.1:180-479(+)